MSQFVLSCIATCVTVMTWYVTWQNLYDKNIRHRFDHVAKDEANLLWRRVSSQIGRWWPLTWQCVYDKYFHHKMWWRGKWCGEPFMTDTIVIRRNTTYEFISSCNITHYNQNIIWICSTKTFHPVKNNITSEHISALT